MGLQDWLNDDRRRFAVFLVLLAAAPAGLLLGSVAERVIREAQVPVTVVR